MENAPSSHRVWSTPGRAVVAAIVILTAFAVWLNLPPSVIVFNDDFGYVKSVVETVRRSRPWTDDWLEPWAASQSVFSALLYKITGSFRAAIYGNQALFAGGIVGMLAVLMVRRGINLGFAVAWALILASAPPLLFKIGEFGAMPLYVFCLLVAVWAAERESWLGFGMAWLVAVASRQSALLWLVVPLGIFLSRTTDKRRKAGWAFVMPGLAIVGAILVHRLFQRYMNLTNAQRVMQHDPFANLRSWNGVRQVAIALAVGLVAAGFGKFIGIFSNRTTDGRTGHGHRWLIAGVSVIIVTLWIGDIRKWIEIEHDLLHGWRGSLYLGIIDVFALCGWWLGEARMRWPYAAGVLAMAGLMALRGAIWDYYLIDIAVFAFLGVCPPETGIVPRDRERRSEIHAFGFSVGLLAVGVFAVFHSTFIARTKTLLDENYGMIQVEERVLRTGKIAVQDLSVASFGYRGWNLYPYFMTHDGVGQYIANFQHYIHDDASRFQIDGPLDPAPAWTNGKLKNGEILLASQIFPRGWSQQRRYSLIQTAEGKGSELLLGTESYRRPVFPLNDVEWAELINR